MSVGFYGTLCDFGRPTVFFRCVNDGARACDPQMQCDVAYVVLVQLKPAIMNVQALTEIL